MENAFFPRTWRGNLDNLDDSELNLPLGTFNFIQIEKKFINTIKNFIESIFVYDNLIVNYTKEKVKDSNTVSAYSGNLIKQEDKHTSFKFLTRTFNDEYYQFEIKNIPALESSQHIKVLFKVLMEYMRNYSDCISQNLPIEDGVIKASESFVTKTDIWSYNIEKTLIIEYLYNLFNTFDNNYENDFSWASKPLRYEINLINSIYELANEISSRKIENKEIFCGFIFHDHPDQIDSNSVKYVQFQDPIAFGDFSKLKKFIEVSNGQNIFFNVSKGLITHVFITKDSVNEIFLDPLSTGKTFSSRPLIVSIQGNGKIHFIEGKPNVNKTVLQIFHSRPVIKDSNFIKQFLIDTISEISNEVNGQVELFVKWIMSLSQKRHGASLIFKNLDEKITEKFVKTVEIKSSSTYFNNSDRNIYDISILDGLINPDGTVIFNKSLNLTNISTILPISENSTGTFGGARHNSVANFTKEFKCTGIVVSEDGPISIFKDGKRLMKF